MYDRAMQRRARSLTFVVVALLVVVGCGSSSTGPSSPGGGATSPEATRICTASCAKRKECLPATDTAHCQEQCTSNPRVRRAKVIRPDLVDAVVSCVEHAECGSAHDVGMHVKTCLGTAMRSVTPNDKTRSTCAKLESFAASCQDQARPGCVELLKLAKDEYLDRMAACANESCRGGTRCLHDLRDEITD